MDAYNMLGTSWVDGADGSHFPIQNLPFGIFSHAARGLDPRPGVAIGDSVAFTAGKPNLHYAKPVGTYRHSGSSAAVTGACVRVSFTVRFTLTPTVTGIYDPKNNS